jgi:hypothetical protein
VKRGRGSHSATLSEGQLAASSTDPKVEPDTHLASGAIRKSALKLIPKMVDLSSEGRSYADALSGPMDTPRRLALLAKVAEMEMLTNGALEQSRNTGPASPDLSLQIDAAIKVLKATLKETKKFVKASVLFPIFGGAPHQCT